MKKDKQNGFINSSTERSKSDIPEDINYRYITPQSCENCAEVTVQRYSTPVLFKISDKKGKECLSPSFGGI